MLGIGVIEGFFGPEWSWEFRHHICESLRSYGGEFYLYAPKRDSFLRKNWEKDHPAELWSELKNLSAKCSQAGIAFGVGLSPFEVHTHWNETTKEILRQKIKKLEELNIQYLGLFFDDMRGSPDLADKQLEIVGFVQSVTNKTILFCPTYYSPDPILDKVFGQREPDYLEKIGTLPKEVQIFWTGNKVIPSAISGEELDEVALILKRKPLIWDNYFANDGPRQCKFLKLKPFEGRNPSALKSSAGWAMNLMNQPNLSEMVLVSAIDILRNNRSANDSFYEFAQQLGGTEFTSSLKKYSETYLTLGLDKTEQNAKDEILNALSSNRFSQDITDWLNGKYIVGPECLTD